MKNDPNNPNNSECPTEGQEQKDGEWLFFPYSDKQKLAFKMLADDNLFDQICYQVESGELLIDVLTKYDAISVPHFYRFININERHKEKFLHARITQMHVFSDQILKESKNRSRDVIENEKWDKDGNVIGIERRSDNTAVNRDRLITDNMKFLMARLAGTTYSEKQQIEHSGSINVQPVIELNLKGFAPKAVDVTPQPAEPKLLPIPNPFVKANADTVVARRKVNNKILQARKKKREAETKNKS